MKKFCVFILSFIMLFAIGCSKTESDKIIDIEVCGEFYTADFYIGEQIDLTDYTAVIKYESGLTKTLTLDNFVNENIETTEAGDLNIVITYEGFSKTISVNIKKITLVNCTYKGNDLVIYKGETTNIAGLTFTAVYSDGSEGVLDLSLVSIPSLDYSLDGIRKVMSVAYLGVSFDIGYTVTCRAIAENTNYQINNVLEYFDEDAYAIRVGEVLYIYNSANVQISRLDLIEEDFNRYKTLMIKNGLKNFYVYLDGNVITFEEISE